MTWRGLLRGVVLVGLLGPMVHARSFDEEQQRYPRYRAAVKEKAAAIEMLFDKARVAWPPQAIYLRALKQERLLELWARSAASERFVLLTTYAFCASSGSLGPKRRQGDLQIPEGFYHVDRFNPASRFHLSLGLDYPNRSDRILGDPSKPGGDIFIHGSCVTIGCIPITDDRIKELYVIAVAAHASGQRQIPVHVFPARLDDAGLEALSARHAETPSLIRFWRGLQAGYTLFETHRRMPRVSIGSDGGYQFAPPAPVR